MYIKHTIMKTTKLIFSFLLTYVLLCSSISYAQKSADEIKKLIETQNFVFKATEANPLRGGSRQLSLGYDLTITKGSVIAFLPFYGRARAATMNPADGGIKFTSTNFDYKSEAGKRGMRITIKPNDASGVQQLFLNIYDNGTATLDVMNTGRDNISFRGYIQ
jgi:Domain of unknown function (DUF4251)